MPCTEELFLECKSGECVKTCTTIGNDEQSKCGSNANYCAPSADTTFNKCVCGSTATAACSGDNPICSDSVCTKNCSSDATVCGTFADTCKPITNICVCGAEGTRPCSGKLDVCLDG